MMPLAVWLIAFCCLFLGVAGNTEKIIFLAPESISLPDEGPGLAELQLDVLSPARSTIQTTLSVVFTDDKDQIQEQRGNQSWFLLQGLQEHRRYEVRVCWSATQPTRFALEKYSLASVFETPSLISGLAAYSDQRFSSTAGSIFDLPEDASAAQQSLLFLRIWSAADYFTTNDTLMREPLPVKIDIILDPYVLNVFPWSLLPTAAYIVVLATISWYISGLIWGWLVSVRSRKVRRD